MTAAALKTVCASAAIAAGAVIADTFEFGGQGLVNGRKHALPLATGNRLPLRHELFNGPGLFLDRSGGEVALRYSAEFR